MAAASLKPIAPVSSYAALYLEKLKQEKAVVQLKIEQLKVLQSVEDKYKEVRADVVQNNLPIESYEKNIAALKFDDPKYKQAAMRGQERELAVAAKMGQELLRLELPDKLKVHTQQEQEKLYKVVSKFILDNNFMGQWVKNGLLTQKELDELQIRFGSSDLWQLTPAEKKSKYLQKIFGVTEAGMALLLQEEFNRSYYGRAMGWLSNLSTMALLASVAGIGGYEVFIQFFLRYGIYPMARTAAAGAAMFLGIAQDSFISKSHTALVRKVQLAQGYVEEKMKGFGKWIQEKMYLPNGAIVFFLALLAISAPTLMFLSVPLWAQMTLMIQSTLITPLLDGVGPFVRSALASMGIKTFQATVLTAKTGVKAAISGPEAALVPLLGKPSFEAVKVLAKTGWAGVKLPFKVLYNYDIALTSIISLTLLSPLIFFGIGGPSKIANLVPIAKGIIGVTLGASFLVAIAAFPPTWWIISPIISTLTANMLNMTVLSYGVTIASNSAFLGVHFLRNGLRKHLAHKLRTSKSPRLAALQRQLIRWGPVLDSMVHIAVIVGTGYVFSGNIYLAYLSILRNTPVK